jgi:hypothetical protein
VDPHQICVLVRTTQPAGAGNRVIPSSADRSRLLAIGQELRHRVVTTVSVEPAWLRGKRRERGKGTFYFKGFIAQLWWIAPEQPPQPPALTSVGCGRCALLRSSCAPPVAALSRLSSVESTYRRGAAAIRGTRMDADKACGSAVRGLAQRGRSRPADH